MVSDVNVICEQDGVVRHHRVTGRQDASRSVVYTVQDTVVHQQVVHQQLSKNTHTLRSTSKYLNKPNSLLNLLTPNSLTPL